MPDKPAYEAKYDPHNGWTVVNRNGHTVHAQPGLRKETAEFMAQEFCRIAAGEPVDDKGS